MCATRKNKGTLYGVKLLKKYLNEMKRKYKNFYILKIDISKYFYNIDHDILKKIIKKKIKDKDAFILNKIMGYKLKKLSNTFKAGFPNNSLDNVLNNLNINNINYIIVEDKII